LIKLSYKALLTNPTFSLALFMAQPLNAPTSLRKRKQPWAFDNVESVFKRIKEDGVVDGAWKVARLLKNQDAIHDALAKAVAMEVDKLDEDEKTKFKASACSQIENEIRVRLWEVGTDRNIAWTSACSFGCSFGHDLRSFYNHDHKVDVDQLMFQTKAQFETFWETYRGNQCDYDTWSSYHAMWNCLDNDVCNGEGRPDLFSDVDELEKVMSDRTCLNA
jgi:hypothetical protein